MILLCCISANEWKKFGLHFAYFIFQGLQKDVYLQSFKKLASAVMTLLGPVVKRSDIRRAEIDIHEFVIEYEVGI